MAMYLTEEQDMLADSARPFIADTAPVSHLRALRDADDPTGFSHDVWRQLAEMGFTGILVGEAHGGLALGHVEAGVVLEEIGRNVTPSPFLATSVGAVTALAGASEALRGEYLPRIVSGDLIAALAFDEGVRHRPDRVALKAERSGNGFRLSGAKSFVQHGHAADLLIVSARTSGKERDEEGVTLFAVPRDAKGLAFETHRLTDSSLSSRILFDGLELDCDAVIGEIDAGRAGCARQSVGDRRRRIVRS